MDVKWYVMAGRKIVAGAFEKRAEAVAWIQSFAVADIEHRVQCRARPL